MPVHQIVNFVNPVLQLRPIVRKMTPVIENQFVLQNEEYLKPKTTLVNS